MNKPHLPKRGPPKKHGFHTKVDGFSTLWLVQNTVWCYVLRSILTICCESTISWAVNLIIHYDSIWFHRNPSCFCIFLLHIRLPVTISPWPGESWPSWALDATFKVWQAHHQSLVGRSASQCMGDKGSIGSIGSSIWSLATCFDDHLISFMHPCNPLYMFATENHELNFFVSQWASTPPRRALSSPCLKRTQHYAQCTICVTHSLAGSKVNIYIYI